MLVTVTIKSVFQPCYARALNDLRIWFAFLTSISATFCEHVVLNAVTSICMLIP